MIRDATLADARGIARVGVESWRTTYRGLFPDSVLDRLDVDQQAVTRERWLREMPEDQFVLVAEGSGEIVGFCGGGPARGEPPGLGEVYAIYLLEAHQGRGIGRALMREGARRLHAAGLAGLLVWVLRENAPARAFYERLGGVAEREKEDAVYGGAPDAPRLAVIETGYVWKDTAALRA